MQTIRAQNDQVTWLEIHIRLINVVSGASADTKKGALSLAAGPNTAKWFCAEAATEAATESAQHAVEAASTKSKYDIHYAQIPLDQQNFTTAAGVAGEAKCEARCDANKACLGFTYIGWPQNPTTGQCYFYAHVPELKNYPGADWFQKPEWRTFRHRPPRSLALPRRRSRHARLGLIPQRGRKSAVQWVAAAVWSPSR